MYHSLLQNTIFYNSLFALDLQIANQYQQSHCPFCGGKLHQAHYRRIPLGVPTGVHEDYSLRFSYCCANDGCRKRLTTPSMRFLSQKQYSSVIILVIFMLKSKTDESKVEELNRLIDGSLSVETLRRWRCYWVNKVTQSHTFKRAAFIHEDALSMPCSLLAKFKKNAEQSLELALKWLLPLTTGVTLFDKPVEVKI